jgi:hypothetical protein
LLGGSGIRTIPVAHLRRHIAAAQITTSQFSILACAFPVRNQRLGFVRGARYRS